MTGMQNKKGYPSQSEAFLEEERLSEYYHALSGMKNQKNSFPLFHYTSTKVLHSILNKGSFWATNVFYLNDKIEYKKGIQRLREIFSRDSESLSYLDEIGDMDGRNSGIFSISFSTEGDALQHWITYAKESGVCIEFHSSIMCNVESDLDFFTKIDKHSCINYSNHCLMELEYSGEKINSQEKPKYDAGMIKKSFAQAMLKSSSENTKEHLLESEINKIWVEKKDMAVKFLSLVAVYFKDVHFGLEHEIRAAFLPGRKNGKCSKIQYADQHNGVLRPYLEVFFSNSYRSSLDYKIGRSVECPIVSITVGPGGNQEAVFQSIVHRLKFSSNNKLWKYSDTELDELREKFISSCLHSMKIDLNIEAEELSLKELQIRNRLLVLLGKSKEDTELLEEQFEAYLETHLRNNFFSDSGVSVRKSKISYIF